MCPRASRSAEEPRAAPLVRMNQKVPVGVVTMPAWAGKSGVLPTTGGGNDDNAGD